MKKLFHSNPKNLIKLDLQDDKNKWLIILWLISVIRKLYLFKKLASINQFGSSNSCQKDLIHPPNPSKIIKYLYYFRILSYLWLSMKNIENIKLLRKYERIYKTITLEMKKEIKDSKLHILIILKWLITYQSLNRFTHSKI